ncbi:MAG: DUF6879 family protein [Pseudonocardiaceae bacterium]
MTLEQLTELVATTRRDLFRIETLPSYDTAITTSDFRRWLDDEPDPDWEARRPWLDLLTRWAEEGRPRRRVRVIHDPPTDYQRYACDWGYRNNVAAGELVRVLDLADQAPPGELRSAPGDWTLIDDGTVVTMRYGHDGQLLGAELLDVAHVERYRLAAEAVWNAAEPFTPWWDRHPQHHRSVRGVASKGVID